VILPAQEIRRLRPLDPFVEREIAFGTTYGLGPAGYDVRIAEMIWLWRGRFLLASTIEHFDMPNDVMAIVHDKSTWARRGVAVQNTVIEPGWRLAHLGNNHARLAPAADQAWDPDRADRFPST
jgi:dCTP deaminase